MKYTVRPPYADGAHADIGIGPNAASRNDPPKGPATVASAEVRVVWGIGLVMASLVGGLTGSAFARVRGLGEDVTKVHVLVKGHLADGVPSPIGVRETTNGLSGTESSSSRRPNEHRSGACRSSRKRLDPGHEGLATDAELRTVGDPEEYSIPAGIQRGRLAATTTSVTATVELGRFTVGR